MRGWDFYHIDQPDTHTVWVNESASVRLGVVRPYAAVPLVPIPLGFTLNTLFYAAIIFLPLFGIAALKRYRRVKRGLCRSCAYDLAGLPTCPECGTPSSPPAA